MTKINKRITNLTINGLIKVVATLIIISSLASLFDSHHRYLELFSNFKFQYLMGSLICAVILSFYKHFVYTTLLLIVAFHNSFYIVPWYFNDSENTSLTMNTDITILHSNVFRDNESFDEFIALVNAENPDVFIMQEVNEEWLSQIKELENQYTHNYKTPRNDNFGMAIYSKIPFESVKKVKWIPFNVPSIVTTFEISDQLVTVITTHPLPPISQEYYEFRNSQINKIAEISREKQGPLIVIGDLNITAWSHDYMPLEIDTDLRNARKGFGLLPTWPTQFQFPLFMIPIDHCLVSSHFVVNDIKVGNDIGSDHLPLIVKLGLK